MKLLGYKAAGVAGLLSFGVAASCSGSDGRQITREEGGEAGEAQAGSGDHAQAGEGTAGSVGGTGQTMGGSSPLAGAAGEPGSSVGGGSVENGGAPAESGANSGGASVAGAGGADACCSAADYDAASSGAALPSDVACSPWILADSAAPEEPGFTGDYLSISSSADAESMYFMQQDANLTFPSIFTFEARIRLVSGAGSTPSRGPASMFFIYGPQHMKNMLQLTSNQVFILAGENQKGDAFTFDTTSDFHTYKIVVDTTLDTFDVFVDDVLELSGETFVDPSNSPEVVAFGESSIYAYGSSQWAFVRHNAYVCTD